MKTDDLIKYLESTKDSKGCYEYVSINGNSFTFSASEIQSPFDGEYYVTLENPESMDIDYSLYKEGKDYAIIPCRITGVDFRKSFDGGYLICVVDLEAIDKSIIPKWFDMEEYHDDFAVNFIALNHHPMTPLQKQEQQLYLLENH